MPLLGPLSSWRNSELGVQIRAFKPQAIQRLLASEFRRSAGLRLNTRGVTPTHRWWVCRGASPVPIFTLSGGPTVFLREWDLWQTQLARFP